MNVQALPLCFENLMRAIDPSKNQPNRLICDRARECQSLVGTSRTGGRFARRWQFNALKEILKAATSLDVKMAHSDGDSADFDACLAAPPCLLKTHAFVPRLDVAQRRARDARGHDEQGPEPHH